MIGKTILHYNILAKLGEGGMGVVYKAEDTKLERLVALKFLPTNTLTGAEEKKRFKREAKAAAALNHPNICHIYAIDEADDQLFIAMEFIEGKSLAEMVAGAYGGVPLLLNDAINYASQIATGLPRFSFLNTTRKVGAHEKGITHRDIKSANIMVTDKGQVKIMDFGLAKLGNRSMMTREGTTLGTAAYMSPERARGEIVDHRTDIWALGVVLYEMISGQLPFRGEYEQAMMYSILNEEVGRALDEEFLKSEKKNFDVFEQLCALWGLLKLFYQWKRVFYRRENVIRGVLPGIFRIGAASCQSRSKQLDLVSQRQ